MPDIGDLANAIQLAPIRADVERARRRLQRGADPARVLDELSRRLTNKLLHAPLRALSQRPTQ
jgi:glutamyl-tRNA reductase